MNYDSIVIGSGVSGLTGALLLAQKGHKVALIEKDKKLAPLLRRFSRKNKWCDPGFHYSGGFTKSGTLSVIFRYMGLRSLINTVEFDSKGFDRLRLDEDEILIPHGYHHLQEVLNTTFPQDKNAIQFYLDLVAEVISQTPFFNFDLNPNSFPENPLVLESLDTVLSRAGAEVRLKNFLGEYGQILYGASGAEVPFYIHAMTLGSYYNKPHLLEQGGDSIVNAFKQRIKEENIDVYSNSVATEIIIDNNRRLTGVKVTTTGNRSQNSSEVLSCENCISTIHPELLADLIPTRAVRPAFHKKLRQVENTSGVFVLFLGLQEKPEQINRTNYYILPDQNTLPEEALSFMSCAGEDKSLCLLRCHPQYANEYTSQNNTNPASYQQYKNYMIQDTLSLLEQYLPGLKGKYELLDCATPQTYQRYTGTPRGSMYGVKKTINQTTIGIDTSIRGLFLAGQSTLMPGVMSSVISGFLSAAKIIDMDLIWDELVKCR